METLKIITIWQEGASHRARIIGERIECADCGALLGIINNDGFEIKCKHKSRGKFCDTINIVKV
jgi:hypothetical protein